MEEDFFLYHNNSNQNLIFNEYSKYKDVLPLFDFFTINDIKNKEFIKNLITTNKTNNEIKTLYEQFIYRNKSTYYDLYLNKIKNICNKSDLIELFYDLIFKKLINGFLSILVEPNINNPKINSVYFNFEKLILNYKEYYLLREYKQLRNNYVTYIKKITNNSVNALNIIYFEIKLAKLINNEKLYNQYNYQEISNDSLLLHFLNLTKKNNIFINEILIDNLNILSFIKYNIDNNFQTIKDYLLFNYINLNYSLISENNEEFKFNHLDKYILGTKILLPTWIRSINYLENHFGDILGYYYGINSDNSTNIKNLYINIENIIIETKKFINNWSNNDNKYRILKKIDNIKFKIGYPQIKYNINIELTNDFFLNHINLNYCYFINNLNLYNKPKIDYWKILPYHTNAMYSPIDNEIIIPLTLFYIDPDIFDFIISHEIVHSFDNNGIKFDYNGFFNNNYNLTEDFYLKLKSTINHKYLNEIIADIIGLKISFNVYKKKNYNKHQNFFIKYAKIFKYFINNTEYNRKQFIDIHPLNNYRVNFSLSHLSEFYQTFIINQNNKMWTSPDYRI